MRKADSEQEEVGVGGCSVVNPFQRPRFDVRLLLLATTVSAFWLTLWPVASVGGRVLLAVYGLTYVFGCYATRRGVLFVLPAVYLPVCVAHLGWGGWDSGDRWRGEIDFWMHPGYAANLFLAPSSSAWFPSAAALLTVAFFLLAVSVARVSKELACAIAAIVLLASAINCWIVFAMLNQVR